MAVSKEFYKLAEGVTATELAKIIDADAIVGPADTVIETILPFSNVVAGALAFQSNAGLARDSSINGAILIVTRESVEFLEKTNSCLVVESPRVSFAVALEAMVKTFPDNINQSGVSADAKVSDGVRIHPSATVMEGVQIGRNTRIGPGAVIYHSVQIGDNCCIGANAVLSYCIIGDNVDIGSSTVIGGPGFGFEMTASGPVKMPHIGLVRVGSSVMIGSGCAIDRGSLGDTSIASNVMMDNLCHVAHNVAIGSNSIIAGQAGISGSVHIGKNVMMGGQVGIAPHIKVGDGAILTARSGVTKDVPSGSQVAGFPAVPARQFWRDQAVLRRLMKQPSAKPKA